METRSDIRRLKVLREALGMTQRELAKELAVTPGAVGLWESGRRPLPGPVDRLLAVYEEELGLKKKEISRIETSWLNRSARLGAVGASAATRFAAASITSFLRSSSYSNTVQKRVHEAVARQAVDTLGELKGLVMKVGQMASYMDFALPEGLREPFKALQQSTPPMSPEAAAGVLIDAFGKTPSQLFASWNPMPVAAASIGQVHRATLRSGEEVAVKIQYPGIRRSLEADFKSAEVVNSLAALLFRGQEKGVLLSEIQARFLEECDYRREAENQEYFRSFFKDDPRIAVPRHFAELSTDSVLTSEWMEGERFYGFASRAGQAERTRAGETILDFTFHSIFKGNRFNGDPHPGNYLFRDGEVVFLDFGCVKRFDSRFIGIWREHDRAILSGDLEKARLVAIEMGLVPDPESYDFDYHHKMMDILFEPFATASEFEFTHEYVSRTWRAMITENKNRHLMNVPRDWVLTNRLQWGLYSVLAELRARSNWRRRLTPLLGMPE